MWCPMSLNCDQIMWKSSINKDFEKLSEIMLRSDTFL